MNNQKHRDISKKERLYQIISSVHKEDLTSKVYNYVLTICIIVSIIPLALKHRYAVFNLTDVITTFVFLVDYILRIVTAPLKYPRQKGVKAYFRYLFSFMGIVDLLSILPILSVFGKTYGDGFRFARLLRMIRIVRMFKLLRYSKNIRRIVHVLHDTRDSLIIVCFLALGYILASALIVFNVEPQTFDSFFHAIYWATVSLTTVGYGDLYPVSTAGQVVTIFSSIMGVAVVALPASIVTAGFMAELNKEEALRKRRDDIAEKKLTREAAIEAAKQAVLEQARDAAKEEVEMKNEDLLLLLGSMKQEMEEMRESMQKMQQAQDSTEIKQEENTNE